MKPSGVFLMTFSAAVLLLTVDAQLAARPSASEGRGRAVEPTGGDNVLSNAAAAVPPGNGNACPPGLGFTRCQPDNVCVNIRTDTKNCGACDNTCSPGFQCISGACTCPLGNIVCGVQGELSCVPDAFQCATCQAPPPVIEYTCRVNLTATALTNDNGCDTTLTCDNKPGALCVDNGTPSGTFNLSSCAHTAAGCPINVNQCGPAAFCAYSAKLCFETCCERDGPMTIQGESLAACEPGCCGVEDNLYLYNTTGALSPPLAGTTNAPNQILADVTRVNYTTECSPGQCFSLCENVGIIRTNTVRLSQIVTGMEPCDTIGGEEISTRIISCTTR